MQRLDYFIKRLLLIVPTFIGITLAVFILIQFVPGGPVEQQLAQMRGAGNIGGANVQAIAEEQREALMKEFGWDKPILVRYWDNMVVNKAALTMHSIQYRERTTWELIRSRFKVSLIFGITGFVLTYLICIPLGIAKALRDGGAFDIASSIVVFTGYAIPAFAFGMLLKMFFTGTVEGFWDFFPVAGFTSPHYAELSALGKVKDIAWHMFLPVLCYMVGNFAVLTLLMKNSLLEQIGKDYIRTVLAKGGSSRRAIWGHALRNSMIPIVTGIGGIMTVMFAGSVLIEKVFEIPGMGLLSLEVIVNRDYPTFMAILSLTSILGLIGNIVSDMAYVLIDPRINFE